jgi:hypothetical protein
MAHNPDHRSEERIPTSRRATARVALSLELQDISAHGLRARCSLRFSIGTVLRFTLPGAVETHARVVWSDGEHVGCDLLRPLTSLEIERITAEDPALYSKSVPDSKAE